MSLRATIYAKQKKKDYAEWRFDTIGSNPSDIAFTIVRSTDNVEQNFTYGQITDGTYDAFLAGATGLVRVWRNGTNNVSNGLGYLMKLMPNAGNPYIEAVLQSQGLHGSNIVSNFNNDWIVSIIHGKELNGNNQRLNLGISGNVLHKNFIMSCAADNKAYLKLNSTMGDGFINSELSVNITTIDKLDVYTYTKIAGILTIRKNNVVLTQSPSTFSVRFRSSNNLNYVSLNNTLRDVSASGKVNKYQHIGHVADKDLSGFNLTGYINSLMAKYSIT